MLLLKKGLTSKQIYEDMANIIGDGTPSYPCEHAIGAGRSQTVCAQENVDRVCDLIKQDRRVG